MAKLLTLSFAALSSLATLAAIPVRWSTDAYKVKPLVYDCYHGETLDLAATITAYGEPLDLAGKAAHLYWQTNGMGAAWWSTNGEVRAEGAATNILAAVWRGAFDTGADAVTGFIGVEGENYRAAFTLRFRASPGFEPNVLTIPPLTIDWGRVTNVNATLAPFVLRGSAEHVDAPMATNIAEYIVSTNGLATTNYVNALSATKQDALPYATNAIPAAVIAGAPWLTVESDPTVGLTNRTVYASGTNVTFLTSETDPEWSAAKSQYQRVIPDYATTNAVCDIVTNDVAATDWVTNITATSGGNEVTLLNVKWGYGDNPDEWMMKLRVPGIGEAWRPCAAPNNTDTNATTLAASEYPELVTTRTFAHNALGLAYLRELVPTVTNTVTKAYVESLGIEAGVSASAVTGIVASASVTNAGAYVAATNAAAAGAAEKYLPATHDQYIYYVDDDVYFNTGRYIYFGGDTMFYAPVSFGSDVTVNGFDKITTGSQTLQSALDAKADADSVYTKAQITGNTVTNGGAKAYADTANAATRAIVTQWESFLDGSNVVFSITNYISGSYSTDYAKLRILELTNGVYREVYSSHTDIQGHIDAFKTNDFRVATNMVITTVNAAVAGKADKAWGKYASSGAELSTLGYSNTVYLTAPQTVFAGGTEYERVAVGEGAICVLTTKGAPVYTQGDEGTFKFQSDGGTNFFGFARTDSYVIGCDADSISVASSTVTLTFSVMTGIKPCVWYKANISSSDAWEQLNLPDGSPISGASHGVTWEASPEAGTEVCHINVTGEPQGFFRFTLEVSGAASFITNMPADLQGGIVCTNTATGANGIVRPSYNGSSVIWTWSAQ